MNRTLKSTLLTVLAVLPAAISLSACTPEPDLPGCTFWYTFNKTTESKLVMMANNFEKLIEERDGVKIKVKLGKYGGYPNIKETIEKNLTVGNIPTMAVAYPDHIANYMEKGRVEGDPGKYVWQLDEYFNDPDIGFGKQPELGETAVNTKEDFFAPFIEEGTKFIKEGTYSLPLMKSTEALYYNETLLKQYLNHYQPYQSSGKSLKRYIDSLTWDEFIALCEFVKADMDAPSAEQKVKGTKLTHVLAYDSDANLFITRLEQLGIGYSSIDYTTGKGVIDFQKENSLENFEKVRDELSYLKGLYDNKILLTKKTNDNKYSSDKFTAQETLFAVGSTGGAGNNQPKGGAFTFGVTKVPGVSGHEKYITQGVTLTFLKNPTLTDERNKENMSYAWQFAKYLTAPEHNVSLCFSSEGYFPVRKSALETDEWAELDDDAESIRTKTMKAITDNIKHSYFTSPVFKGSAELRTAVESLLAQALIEGTTDAKIESLITAKVNEALTKM